jgi:trigger factor
VAELVDAPDLGSGGASRGGSSPSARTSLRSSDRFPPPKDVPSRADLKKAKHMQVTETLSQGLKREFRVVLPAGDLAARLEKELADLKDKVRINGFRPGKVPVAHLRRVYGRSIMGDVVQNAVTEANRKIVEDLGVRLALEPKIEFPKDQAEVEKALEAKGDLAFQIAVEVLPKFDVGTFESLDLERLVAEVGDAEVDQTLNRMADQNRPFSPKDGGADTGDKVAIDFTGTIDGEPFEGGAGTDIDVVMGSDAFIPGFESQLTGIKAGEEREVVARFPDTYLASHLAGKEAHFQVTAKSVAAPGAVAIDDSFAKTFGFEDIGKLREAVASNLAGELRKASRDRLKRRLLDALDKRYTFDLPEGLVEQEFSAIWQQVLGEQQSGGKSFADEGTSEEEARAEYRRIAERRVRLGLVLAEVGDKAAVKVADEEVTQALIARARQYPGQEQQVWDFYRKNPERLGEIRAPLFEDKVVDHIIAQAQVTDRKVEKEELFRLEDEEVASGKPEAAA